MKKIITTVIIASMGFLMVGKAQNPSPKTQTAAKSSDATIENTDPVCRMKISKSSKYTSIYKGKKYSFCSKMCKTSFDKTPTNFAKN